MKNYIYSFLRERAVEIVLLFISIYFLRETFVARWTLRTDTFPGPTFLPRLLLSLLIIVLLVMLGEAFIRLAIKKKQGLTKAPISFKECAFALIYLASGVTVIELMCRMTVIIPVTVFLFLWMSFLGYRKEDSNFKKHASNFIISFGGGVGVYFLTKALRIFFIR